MGYYIDKGFIKYEDMVNGKLIERIAPEDNFKNILNSFGY